ncbi:MAG: hypothetical protein J6W10_01990 [Kiritimatiellae bacterium]|nr:hypothetical protein [Kiritimatiellia bacterium]
MEQITVWDVLKEVNQEWKPIPECAGVWVEHCSTTVHVIDQNWKRAERIERIENGTVNGKKCKVGLLAATSGFYNSELWVPIMYMEG